MKEVVFTERAPKPIGPYSQAIRLGNLLFVSGQIPIDPATNEVVKGGIKEQTERVLENVRAILEAANMKLDDVVMAFVYLSDMADFPSSTRCTPGTSRRGLPRGSPWP